MRCFTQFLSYYVSTYDISQVYFCRSGHDVHGILRRRAPAVLEGRASRVCLPLNQGRRARLASPVPVRLDESVQPSCLPARAEPMSNGCRTRRPTMLWAVAARNGFLHLTMAKPRLFSTGPTTYGQYMGPANLEHVRGAQPSARCNLWPICVLKCSCAFF